MPVPKHTLTLLRKLARHNGGIIDATVRDITTGWLQAWDELGPAWQQAVTAIVDQYTKTGVWPAPWQVARIEAIARATQRTEQALGVLLADATTATTTAAAQLSTATVAAEPSVIASQTSTVSAGEIAVPSVSVASALDARRARIGSLFRPVAAVTLAAMVWEFTHQPNAGRRPIAGMAVRVKAGFDTGLVRATTIVQTETVDAYRTASGLVHAANPTVVTGWAWTSSLDQRTCFPAGTSVTTSRGQIPIEQVTVGDMVLSHTGRWQRVYDTMSRDYAGPMVSVESGSLHVTSTSDHPFLAERQGQLQWIEAGSLTYGDLVFSPFEGNTDKVDHHGREVSVERCSDESDDYQAKLLHVAGFSGVTSSDLVVPVRLVDFEGGASANDEVHGSLPSRDCDLLLERDAKGFEAAPNVPLWNRFTGMATVAPNRTETTNADHARHDPEHLSASGALGRLSWPSTCLGAMASLPSGSGSGNSKDRAASLAWSVLGVGARAVERTIAVSVGDAFGDSELDAAANAGLRYLSAGDAACPGAAYGGVLRVRQERLSAALAVSGNAWCRRPAAGISPVRTFSLMGGVAGLAAKSAATSAHPGGRDLELDIAGLTSPFHPQIVSKLTTHIQRVRVFNIEVENDHSYIANGFAVHNCVACWTQHGTRHSIDEAGPDGHPSCRCQRLPLAGTTTPVSAEARFRRLSRRNQISILGPARYELWRTGAVKWQDLATRRSNPGWRDSITPRSVADLQRIADLRTR